ncbi:MAG TPA: transcription antitermination factor NusB [Blastocatellia bacterium]|nr:transcription antitermination factor NusB [Blastocatellia bacterium]
MGARRKARECALQMLFQYDVARQSVEELTTTYWGEMAEAADDVRDFATELAVGAINHLDEIDELIRLRTEHWRISRMAVVDRNLLRLAVYEFLHQPNTPRTVAINEALEIARRFSTQEATQFINGILDAIKRDLEVREAQPGEAAKAPSTVALTQS